MFAVDPHPDRWYLLILFLLLFSWEIGGQNIPADWTDIEEDRQLDAKTIPVRYGTGPSRVIVLIALWAATGFSAVITAFSKTGYSWYFTIAALAAGLYLLLMPGQKLYRSSRREEAMALLEKIMLKVLCKKLGIQRLDLGPRSTVFTFSEKTHVQAEQITQLIQQDPQRFHFRPDYVLEAKGPWEGAADAMDLTKKVLQELL